MMKSVLAIFLLIGIANASSHEWFIKDDNGLDPGRITWAMESWFSAPIVPEANHAGNTPVDLTFVFRPDSSASIIELICPSSFATCPPAITQTVNGGNDNSVKFIDLAVTAGSFGPFGLITRD